MRRVFESAAWALLHEDTGGLETNRKAMELSRTTPKGARVRVQDKRKKRLRLLYSSPDALFFANKGMCVRERGGG